MQAKKRLNNRRFLTGTCLVALVLGLYLQSIPLALFTLTQYIIDRILYRAVAIMIFQRDRNKKKLLFLLALKSFCTIGSFVLIGIFYEELMLWSLFSYFLVLLIFFISIKKDA